MLSKVRKRAARGASSAVVVLIGLRCLGATAHAGAVNKCLAGKLKAVGKSTAAYLKCDQMRDLDENGSDYVQCIHGEQLKFAGSPGRPGPFDESKYPSGSGEACLTFSDAGTLSEVATGVEGSISGDIDNALSSKCDAAKSLCYGKYSKGVLGCYAKAAAKTRTVDPSCLAKVETKLTDGVKGCLAKAAAHADCSAGRNETTEKGETDFLIRTTLCVLQADTPPGGCPACQGLTGGLCWFNGTIGKDCDDVCGINARTYDPATESYAGSGGTAEHCTTVLDELGAPDGALSQSQSCSIYGLGCAYDEFVGRIECLVPATDSGSFFASASRMCACH